MPNFLVRQSIELSVLIEADNEQAAIEVAGLIPLDSETWDTSYSDAEAEESEETHSDVSAEEGRAMVEAAEQANRTKVAP